MLTRMFDQTALTSFAPFLKATKSYFSQKNQNNLTVFWDNSFRRINQICDNGFFLFILGHWCVLLQLNTKISLLSGRIGPNEQEDVSFGEFFKICNPFSGGPYYRYDPGRCSKDAIPIGDLTDVRKLHLLRAPFRPTFDQSTIFTRTHACTHAHNIEVCFRLALRL